MAKELNPDKYVDLFEPLETEADKIAKSAEEEMIKLLKENPKGSFIILQEDNQIDFLFDRDGYYAPFLAWAVGVVDGELCLKTLNYSDDVVYYGWTSAHSLLYGVPETPRFYVYLYQIVVNNLDNAMSQEEADEQKPDGYMDEEE